MQATNAINKELAAMQHTRKRLVPADEAKLSEKQKKYALNLRMALT